MEKIFGGIVVQFREFYKSLGPTKRTALLASFFVAVVTLGIVIFMTSGKDYAILLSNVPADQVPTIIEKLTSKNIPYQLQEGGKTVFPPSCNWYGIFF